MKFKISDPDLPEFIKYFVIEGASALSGGTGRAVQEIWPDMFEKGNEGKREWDLVVSLNGVNLPSRSVFYHIEEQMDDMIARKAAAMIHEKFDGLDEMMEEIKEAILEKLQQKYPDVILDEEVT